MKLATMEVLSEAEIRQLHEATVDILENCGVQVHHRGDARFPGRARAVGGPRHRAGALHPRRLIEDGLATIPPCFEVFDREGELAFVLGDGQPKDRRGPQRRLLGGRRHRRDAALARGRRRAVRPALRRAGSDRHDRHPGHAAGRVESGAEPVMGRGCLHPKQPEADLLLDRQPGRQPRHHRDAARRVQGRLRDAGLRHQPAFADQPAVLGGAASSRPSWTPSRRRCRWRSCPSRTPVSPPPSRWPGC